MFLRGQLIPRLAYGYLTLVGLTSRIRWKGLEHVEAVRKTGGWIYAFWHNRQVLFTYTHRNARASVLVSRSRDGEVIARVMELSGIGAVRGSSSRGAAAAALELTRLLQDGGSAGVTPDGPKGPVGAIKSGVLYLALKSGRPIVPISNAISRKLVLERSWDKFQVPLPFSRAAVVHGPPIRVRSEAEFAEKARELKASLDRITAEAEKLIGGG